MRFMTFIFIFHMVFFSFRLWTFVLSKIRHVGCFSCAFGSYFRVRSSYKKTFKTLKKLKKTKKPKNLF